jgi:exopolyphosphatase/guanosine-5'-triphosphate,3'-diphosphate pyrophosphatase
MGEVDGIPNSNLRGAVSVSGVPPDNAKEKASMDAIMPRWEWRIFARQTDLATSLDAYRRVRHVTSAELYLVSARSQDNAKIRDDKMDIKRIQSIQPDGLEQWMPVMKADFPLSVEQIGEVYRVLELTQPALDRPTYELAAFLDLVRADRRATVVHVEKIRDQYDADGCILEVAEVTFDGDRYQTVAVEHTDPAKVSGIVTELGFAPRDNTNFIRFIRRIKSIEVA